MDDLKTMLYFTLLSGSAALATSGLALAEMENPHQHHHMMMAESIAYQSTLADYEVPDVKLVDVQGAPVSLREDLADDARGLGGGEEAAVGDQRRTGRC